MITLGALGRSVGRALVLDRPLRFWKDELAPVWPSPFWSSGELRARVVAIVDETPDVKTFVLAARAWPGHLAGQYVPIEVEVDGERLWRCYSISSAPNESHVAITVKRAERGRVSSWMHAHLRRGDTVRLGTPGGEFVLPEPLPSKLLLLSGGSGATPTMAILRHLESRRALDDVVYLHAAAAHSTEDVLFAGELARLASCHRGLRIAFHLRNRDGVRTARLDGARLVALVPDLDERETFLCGPSGMMDAVAPSLVTVEAAGRLHRERFVTPAESANARTVHTAEGTLIHLRRRGGERRTIKASGAASLLEELERAGERPPHGCRRGICNRCRCRKHTGIVENAMTGTLSTKPDEEIRLCVSVARSHVELSL